ncbi:hypothetical protein FOA52_010860 [Chlamydomonas sp. UWO 241]|nr:hypothetical protein FOA52_010860 [Chlamydomonas sp. UWO 241]
MEQRLTFGDLLLRVEPWHIVLFLVLTVSYPGARWLLERVVFQHAACALLLPRGFDRSKLSLPPSKRSRAAKAAASRVHKMVDSMWKLSCCGTFVAVIGCLTIPEPWFWDTTLYWVGWPDQEGTGPLRTLCIVELAYYTSHTFILGFWEVPRKDKAVMMFHHFVAIALVGACYVCNYTRSGCVIMLLHDINDVFLELAKVASYVKAHVAANVLFVAFLASWVALRMVAFPGVIMYSTMFESVAVLGYRVPAYWAINALFVVLYCIHVYWLSLISNAALQMVTRGRAEDVREDGDEE